MFRGVAGGAEFTGVVEGVVTNPERVRIRYLNASAVPASLSTTVPGTWQAGDVISFRVVLDVEEV